MGGEAVLVGVMVGAFVAVVAFRMLDRTFGPRRSEQPPRPPGRRASPAIWVLWGIVAAGCLFLFEDGERTVAAAVLLLAGLWAFGGTHRVPVVARWGIGLATLVVTVVVATVTLALVLAIGLGFGEPALDDEDDPRFSIVVVAPIDGPINYDFVQPDPPPLLLDKGDAGALGVEPRIEGRTGPGRAEWNINTDLEDTADVEHCFAADVLFEGSEEVAVPAGTCASADAPRIQSELPS